LSAQGKTDALKKFAEKALVRFEPVGRVLVRTAGEQSAHKQAMIGPLTQQPAGGNEIVHAMRDAELRSTMQGLTQPEKHAAFSIAVERRDFDTTRAMLTAPGPKWLPDDVRERSEWEFAKRTNPVGYAKYQSVASMRETLAAMADMIRQWLIGLGANKDAVSKALNL
jgi:hypothetical protein